MEKGKYKPIKINTGYFMVTLTNGPKQKNFLIHRLVAMHFIDNPLNKKCVNHINMDKSNNNVANLEWLTHSENMKHRYTINPKTW